MNNFADQNIISSSLPTESPSTSRESVSRFKAGCIRIKMLYFNKDSARLLVALIGVILVSFQRLTLLFQKDDGMFYFMPPFLFAIPAIIFSVLSGILSYIYPPQNILLISILSSSVLHLVNLVLLDGFNIDMGPNTFLSFLQITVFATTLPAFHGIWAPVFQLHKSSVLHVPIVLYSILNLYNLDHLSIFCIRLLRFLNPYTLGVGSLVWCAVWMYVNMNFKPNEDVSSSMKMSSPNIATLSTIPWKSMFTSIPVLVIMANYACDFCIMSFQKSFAVHDPDMDIFVIGIVTIIFTLIVLEFYPEVRFTSTINVRKFLTVTYYFCGWVFLILYFFHSTYIYSIFCFANAIYTFGFVVNHMDIAPRYASILSGFIRPIHYVFMYLLQFTIIMTSTYFKSNKIQFIIVFGIFIILNVIVVIFYSIFASAEIQPWAKTVEDGNQQEMETTPVRV